MPKSGEPEKSKTIKQDTKIIQKRTKKKIDLEQSKKEDKNSIEKQKKNANKIKTDETVKKEKLQVSNVSKRKINKDKAEEIDTLSKNASIIENKKNETKEEKKVIVPDISENELGKELTANEEKQSDMDLSEMPKIKEVPLSNLKKSELTKKNNTDKREFQTLEVVILIVLTCIISLVIGSLLGIKFQERNKDDKNIETVSQEIQDFLKDYNYLIENYYGKIDEKELLNTAFKSIVDSLEDSYSGAIDESTSNNFDIELKGDYEGLGIEIINDSDKNILIYGIIPNSPASNADIKVGDKLITVNNVSVVGMTTTDFIKNIVKGSKTSEFTILLERDGEQRTVTIKKEAITLQSVTSKIYNENGKRIAYIKVSIFAENTYEQFKNELEKLETEGFESLIIDLRDNSGGHLITVKNMISLFLDSSHVIYQTESKKGREKTYSTGKVTKKYPIVIVGNAMSASASEVMIGALTEEYGAILIGNQSFGKGTVQELHSLSNGDEYKFTTKKWLTPKGNWVHNNGIQPKIEVTLSREYYGNPIEENDNQLRAALDYLAGVK